MSKIAQFTEALANASAALSKARSMLAGEALQGRPVLSESHHWLETIDEQMKEIRTLCGATEEKKNEQAKFQSTGVADAEFTIWARSNPGVRD